MANKHLIKRSSVTGRAPQASELDFGELALNFADGKLYFKDASGNLQFFTTGGEAEPATTISTTPPSNPQAGDLWWNSEDAALYIYYTDADSSQWVVAAQGGMISTGTDLTAVSSSVVPTSNEVYDLGSPGLRWRDLYLSGSTINLGGATIKTDAASGAIALLPQPTIENPSPSGVVISPTGGVTVVETVDGEIAEGAIEAAANDPTAAPVPIDITTTPPQDGQALVWQAANSVFVPGNVASGGGGGSSLDVYATVAQLPLSGVDTGTMAFVSGNNRLYIWNGTGWFNIALINTNPTITGGLNPSYLFATNGTPLVITLSASDPEGIPLTWSYQVTSGALGNSATVSNVGNVFTITPSTNNADAGVFELTFSASDGVNVGTASSTFTLRFSSADVNYQRSILLTTTTTNNGSNNTFIDSSINNATVTRHANTTQGTFGPFSPAGWSGYFDGTGDYLSVPSSSALDFGTGDFTIETWVNFAALSSNRILLDRWVTGNANAWQLYWRSTGTSIAFIVGSSTVLLQDPSGSNVVANTWNHVAVTRSGTTVRLFINGVVVATATSSLSLSNTLPLGIGVQTSTLTNYFNGHLSNVRIVKGTALYTTNFTPPATSLAVVSGTSLLTLQDSRFIDRSTNNFTVTRNGDVRIAPFSPFSPTSPYISSVNRGSGYFDGTGDYLSVPYSTSAFDWWTENYTIEAWVYPTSFTGWSYADGGNIKPTLIGNKTFNTTEHYWGFGLNTSGNVYFAYFNGASQGAGSSGTATLNAWNHIAMVVNSGTITVYLNGVGTVLGTVSGTPQASASVPLTIGAANNAYINGYVSGLRVVKGTAVYTSNFTPPTAPPTAIANTRLLLNFSDANVFDETGKVIVETLGDAKSSTAAAKYGTTSMAFDGTGDYLTMPLVPALELRGNFTVECWVNPTSRIRDRPCILGNYSTFTANGSLGLFAGHTATNTSKFNVAFNGSFPVINSTADISYGTWQHLALVRNGTTLTLYVNGVANGTSTQSAAVIGTGTWWIGTSGDGTATDFFNGYISDLRITNGVARYTANFTPPTAKLGYSNAE